MTNTVSRPSTPPNAQENYQSFKKSFLTTSPRRSALANATNSPQASPDRRCRVENSTPIKSAPEANSAVKLDKCFSLLFSADAIVSQGGDDRKQYQPAPPPIVSQLKSPQDSPLRPGLRSFLSSQPKPFGKSVSDEHLETTFGAEPGAKPVTTSYLKQRTDSYRAALTEGTIAITNSSVSNNSASQSSSSSSRSSFLEKLQTVPSFSVDENLDSTETLGSRTVSSSSTMSIQSFAESPAAQRKAHPVLVSQINSSKQETSVTPSSYGTSALWKTMSPGSLQEGSYASGSGSDISASSNGESELWTTKPADQPSPKISRKISDISASSAKIEQQSSPSVVVPSASTKRPSLWKRFLSLFSRKTETPEQRAISAAVKEVSEFARQVKNIEDHLNKARGNPINSNHFEKQLIAARTALYQPDILFIQVGVTLHSLVNFASEIIPSLSAQQLREQAKSFALAIGKFKQQRQEVTAQENNEYALLDRLLGINPSKS